MGSRTIPNPFPVATGEEKASKKRGRRECDDATLNLFMRPPNRFCLNVPRLVKLRERKNGRAACYAAVCARSYRLILGLIRSSRGLAPSAFTFIPDCIAACLPSSLDSFCSYPVLQAGMAPEGVPKGKGTCYCLESCRVGMHECTDI